MGLQPPGPNEAGPSNWIERNLQIVDMQAQEVVHMTHQAGNFLPLNRTQAPPDFRHVNPSSNERFQTVPTITRIATNQSVQVSHEDGNNIELTQEGEPYSPTSPLLLHLHDTDSDIVDEMGDEEVTEAPRLRLGLQCTSAMFPGKRRRNGDHARAQSANSFFMFIGNENQVRKKKRQKRYEEWDAKGGFIMRRNPSSDSFFAKTITDVSMAQVLEVEPESMGSDKGNRKQIARTSPLDSTGTWTLKRSRSNSSHSPRTSQIGDTEREGMEFHFSLVVSIADDSTEGEVVGPNQPPRAP